MDRAAAQAFLDSHIDLERVAAGPARVRPPTLDRIRRLTGALGWPQHQYRVIHVTGTNGKTSVTRMISRLLAVMGLGVGTYTSPHLQRINERIAYDGQPLDDVAFADAIAAVAAAEQVADGDRPSHFEVMTAAAFAAFADLGVEVAVVEAGIGGTWDATCVADGDVGVVTNVGLDHLEYLGPTRLDVARDKAGVARPGAPLVVGETDPELVAVLADGPASVVHARGADFDCDANRLAVGGRQLDLRTPATAYAQVFCRLHGRHQGVNAAVAVTAAEAFFGKPLPEDVVTEAFATVTSPGRMEVVRRDPLVLLDGAHNPDGAEALSLAVDEEFAAVAGRILVAGFLKGRDPRDMLERLDARSARAVVACAADWPRAIPVEEVVAAAESLDVPVLMARSVAGAVREALDVATDDDLVLVTGSLYVVGEARTALGLR